MIETRITSDSFGGTSLKAFLLEVEKTFLENRHVEITMLRNDSQFFVTITDKRPIHITDLKKK